MANALLLLVLAAGCAAAPQGAAPSASAVDCAGLGELACLDSGDCTLHRDEAAGAYVCAAAVDPCERGFVQRTARAAECPAGCTFVPARCYCPPDLTCVCGGGPPASCVAESAAAEADAR